jgi:NTE family protein
MNAAVMTYGWAVGGRSGAKQALADFWHRVSDTASMGLLQPSWFDRAVGNHSLSWSPIFPFLDLMTRVFSPYQFNPLNHNAMRDVLNASIDFEVLRKADCAIKLFLSATNVRTGKVKVFETEEISAASILASACLPYCSKPLRSTGALLGRWLHA